MIIVNLTIEDVNEIVNISVEEATETVTIDVTEVTESINLTVEEANALDGADGSDGLSAYEIALDNGFVGTESQWLLSLKGADGADGQDGADGIDGQDGADGQDGVDGIDGTDGLSAYQIAVENGFVGTEGQWLASLKGDQGDPGTDGISSNKVISTLAFGSSFTDTAQTVVTGQTWVTTSSAIVGHVLSDNLDEQKLIDFKVIISDIVDGVGFTITLFTEQEAKGNYSVMCLGI